jgi:hypothetical protein
MLVSFEGLGTMLAWLAAAPVVAVLISVVLRDCGVSRRWSLVLGLVAGLTVAAIGLAPPGEGPGEGGPLSDADVKRIAANKNLTVVSLRGPTRRYGTQVTDAGLKHLRGLKQLTQLDLTGTRVTDAGMKELVHLRNLTSLDLSSTQVTDAGLKEVANLEALTRLELWGTKVTDTGLETLTSLKHLTNLGLGSTRTTAAGIEQLRKVLPSCKITK